MLDETVTMHGYIYVEPEHAPFCFGNLMVSIIAIDWPHIKRKQPGLAKRGKC